MIKDRLSFEVRAVITFSSCRMLKEIVKLIFQVQKLLKELFTVATTRFGFRGGTVALAR